MNNKKKKRNRKVTGRFLVQKTLPKEKPMTLEEIAKGQKDRDVVQVSTDYSAGENSPYWEWAEKQGGIGEFTEIPLANGDFLPEPEDYIDTTERLRDVLQDTYNALNEQEKKVFGYLKVNKTDKEIAEKMNISQQMVNKYRLNIAKIVKERL